MGIQVSCAVLSVNPRARMADGALIQIAGHDLGHPSLQPARGFLKQNHGESERLFSGGAAGAPYANPVLPNPGFCLDDRGQYDFADHLQLRQVAEKVSFSNRDFVQQADHFRLSHGVDREAVVILAQSRNTERLHAPTAPVFQKLQFVVGLKNSRGVVDQVANLNQWIDISGSGGNPPSARSRPRRS